MLKRKGSELKTCGTGITTQHNYLESTWISNKVKMCTMCNIILMYWYIIYKNMTMRLKAPYSKRTFFYTLHHLFIIYRACCALELISWIPSIWISLWYIVPKCKERLVYKISKFKMPKIKILLVLIKQHISYF